MFIRTKISALCIALAFPLLCIASEWQPSDSERSNRKAIEIVNAALQAHGGSRLDSTTVSFSFVGEHLIPLQNTRPEIAGNPRPKSGRVIFTPKGAHVFYDEILGRAGVYTARHRFLIDGDKGINCNLRSGEYRPASANPVLQRVLLLLPHALLQDAARRALTLRYAGEANGRKSISFSSTAGQQVTLGIDAATNRVASAETLIVYPMYGDKTWQHEFSDYEIVNGIALPRRRTTKLSGVPAETLAFTDLQAGEAPPASAFAVPKEFKLNDEDAERAAVKESITEVAKDVYWVGNIGGSDYKILVVLFPGFILAGGAPDGISDRAIAMIGERWPDKPIRFVVPTHHHWDHSAGLRSFIATGATVVVTPGNRALVEETATAPFLIRPDTLARSPKPVKIELIERKRKTIAAGDQRVEIYDIGPTPHADEMVILYIPAAGVVFQGDLFELDDDEPIDALTGNEVTALFLKKLEALALPVKTIIGAEGRAGTMDDLRKTVQLRDSKYD